MLLWPVVSVITGISGAEITEASRYVSKGSWDSIHVVEVNEAESGKEATYKLTTTVMLSMTVDKKDSGNSNMSGSLSRQAKQTCKFDKVTTHLTNIGNMIEKMETTLRKSLDMLYVQKTRDIINGMRKPFDAADMAKETQAFVADLRKNVSEHGAGRKVDSE